MSDKLRKYLGENRELLDAETPSRQNWDDIEAQLPTPSTHYKGWSKWWSIAAIFLLILGGIWFWRPIIEPPSSDQLLIENTDMETEWPEIEGHYTGAILTNAHEIMEYKDAFPELVNEFLQEHERLDSIYIELKEFLKSNNNNQMVLDAMIQNLQLRMVILQRQKSLLEKVKQQKSGNHGKSII